MDMDLDLDGGGTPTQPKQEGCREKNLAAEILYMEKRSTISKQGDLSPLSFASLRGVAPLFSHFKHQKQFRERYRVFRLMGVSVCL